MKLFNHPLIRLLFALFIVIVPFVLLQAMISGELGILLGILGSFIAYIFYVKFWEKRPVYELRITNKSDSVIYKYFGLNSAFSEFVIGLLMGTILICFLVGLLILLGQYHIVVNKIKVNNVIPILINIGFYAGFVEELIFRGILFRLFEEWLGSWVAIFISGLVFGFAHYTNPNATIFTSIAIALEAGILLSAIFIITRRLWMVIGFHFAWNVVQGLVFSIPVSGHSIEGIFNINLTSNSNVWLSGGDFGLEASVFTLILLTALGLAIVYSLEMKRKVFGINIMRIIFRKL